MGLNTRFQFLNNITRIFHTFFYPHVFPKNTNNITKTMLPNSLQDFEQDGTKN